LYDQIGLSRALASTTALACLLLLRTPSARAEIWSYQDESGVIHFTNIQPGGTTAHRWRVAYQTGPGKAQGVSPALSGGSGAAGYSSYPGCRQSRADVVPPRDRDPARYTRYDAYIAEAAKLYSLPEALIRAVIKAESDFDPKVVSCAGAKGLLQIMPYEEKEQGITDVFDPRDNIMGGGRLLRLHANRFAGDLVLTIAAHHAGDGAVRKYKGVPPYATTQSYVKAVLRYYHSYKEHGPLAPLILRAKNRKQAQQQQQP
jgi:hypothetical protein